MSKNDTVDIEFRVREMTNGRDTGLPPSSVLGSAVKIR
jgi:hypothetical protein